MATSRSVLGTSVTVDQVTNLVQSTSIEFIRPIPIEVSCSILKPETKFNFFFDGVNVNHLCTPSEIITDEGGEVTFTLNIPSRTFTTGTKKFFLTERSQVNTVLGDQYCRAEASFTSTGILQRFQTTVTTTNTTTIEEVTRVEVPVQVFVPQEPAPDVELTVEEERALMIAAGWQPPPPGVDPLAQSFFTSGFRGGCFITSVDLYFQMKDDSAPVWVEIRELINGLPSSRKIGDDAISILSPANINLSDDGSVKTNFKFRRMIRLQEDKDYCFVVLQMSQNYNLWCSRLSDASNETGRIIFKQPYVGSLFKSENGTTWIPEQYDDIKFTLYRAQFNTNVESSVDVALHTVPVIIDGSRFQTFEGTPGVVITMPCRHGLDVGSFASIACDERGIYHGVSGALIAGDHEVTTVIDEYSLSINIVGATFNTTGMVDFNGVIREIQIDTGGSNYVDSTPPIVYVNGIDKSADITLTIVDGAIISASVGTGLVDPSYATSHPQITFGGPGSGATAFALANAKFGVLTNGVYHGVAPSLQHAVPNNTNMTATIRTTLADYETGTAQNYSLGKSYAIAVNDDTQFDNALLIASQKNENEHMSANRACVLNWNLSSDNPNVSPIIDLNNSRIGAYGYQIGDLRKGRYGQVIEDIESDQNYGEVLSITISSGGAGYSSVPDVVVSGPGLEQATATCTLTAGVVTGITLLTVGKYFDTPEVMFIGGDPQTVATAEAAISLYNSELNKGSGFAKSRYITKKQILQYPSNAVRVLLTAYQNFDQSVDCYIKTSNVSDNTEHDDNAWVYIESQSSINKQTQRGQFIDYELNITDMNVFDVFSLKFVLRTKTPWDPPIINNYRTIIIAA